ncbi:RagB/SusD family nutrient uptake outer membrane protein [Lutibacter sp. A64]|uniref:RagB/SusD family nutrient uptake outer membrane protein n=1 Tax=Lutibacter sp. A64 TaxID=2918526 RepID=UPI001F063A24|nr:RagB/SusD family nutrient uptake outer membrane protein [Lutibacter sp. A64]UMB55448.1 RagB/SusD family nutrient uptake outer membrane protein [Lutibacter sp. A64]
MKYTKTIGSILFLLLILTSCNNDWLDETSSTQISSDEQFENEEGFKDALMGVYIGMTSPNLYAKDMTYNIVDLLSQQYTSLPTLAQYDEVQRFEYRTAVSTDQIDNLWINSYNVIANINLALEYIDKNKGILNSIDYSIIKGELLALRVFMHFDVIRLYGYGDLANRESLKSEYTIPYVTTYGKDLTTQLSYTDTFNLMESDLNEALELLKEDPSYATDKPDEYYLEVNRNGFYSNREQRMNYYAALALKARLLQWQGKSQEAALTAETVINNSFTSLINPATYSVASDPILYPEVLFSLNVEGFADIVNRFLDASDSGTNYDALYYTQSKANEIFEASNVNIGLTDIRYNTLLDTQTKGLVSIKLLQDTNAYLDQMPLIKLPEMYYILAEYNAEVNPSLAVEYLNTVREHRGILEAIPSDISQENLKIEIMKEYRKEFLSEGQLFFYYKRTGATNILDVSETIDLNDDIYVLPYPDNELEFGNR